MGRTIASAAPDYSVLVIFGAIIVVVVAVWFFRKSSRIKRGIRRLPTTAIRDAVDGTLIKIVGNLVLPTEPLIAPITGRRCSHFKLTVREHDSEGMTTLCQDQATTDFLVRDATGTALVQVEAADVAVTMDHVEDTRQDLRPELAAILARERVNPRGLIFNKRLRFEEGVLEEEERVAVVGWARWEPDPTGGGAAKRLIVSGVPGSPLQITDDLAVVAASSRPRADRA